MSHFIITAIVVLLAAKAKPQAKDRLTSPEIRVESEGKRGLAKKGGVRKKASHLY